MNSCIFTLLTCSVLSIDNKFLVCLSFQEVNTPAAIGRFLHLKYLEIGALTPNISPDYDFYSLVSFLDASPALETFILRVSYHLSQN
jgi:hypothetical protein